MKRSIAIFFTAAVLSTLSVPSAQANKLYEMPVTYYGQNVGGSSIDWRTVMKQNISDRVIFHAGNQALPYAQIKLTEVFAEYNTKRPTLKFMDMSAGWEAVAKMVGEQVIAGDDAMATTIGEWWQAPANPHEVRYQFPETGLQQFLVDGKRTDPADAGDLLIRKALGENPEIWKTFEQATGALPQVMNWTPDSFAKTDPADAGHLLGQVFANIMLDKYTTK